MSVKNLLDWHERQSVAKLGQEAKAQAEAGFELVYEQAPYSLKRVTGSPEQRHLAFQSIASDLPGNCLGRSHTYYYLHKPDTDILVLKDESNKNLVAIEYNRKTRTIHQVEGNKPKGEGRIPEAAPYLAAFLSFICQLVKDGKLAAINGISHLENAGPLSGKVITRRGDILPKQDVPETEIFFPTPIFSEAIKISYPSESNRTPQDFFKPRDPKSSGLIRKTYVEAGIYLWSRIFDEVGNAEATTPIVSLKAMELNKSATDQQITARLGIQCGLDGSMTPQQERNNQGKIFTLKEIQTLIETQMSFTGDEIKEGYLLRDGYANIFYVKGSDGKLRTFYCSWCSDTHGWCVVSARFGGGWYDGLRVFARNIP
jgi:hypothetical protein